MSKQIASITLLNNDDARPVIESIMEDNPGVTTLNMPGAIKLDCDKKLVIKTATVEEKIGREWDPQEIHMIVVSMSGNLDEDDDSITIGWGLR